ncbi:leucine-rich repeat-containing protein 37A2 [Tyto alba]|uniref:leucine-rich repeat-containing protein 37A2 n=1 Tax=Tyto alba TaxID=56313 RepID=UPI001C67E280|nr:leucine-rich repeat-containing protein 37A2 [Tyto alba]
MGLPRPSRWLLLPVLLLAAAARPGQPRGPCPPPCRCPRRLLNCSRAALASVPPATRRWALSVLDFTHNSISSIKKQVWREYPWAEYLVLQDNDLREVKRHSLEGLLLLKYLDLSYNKILSIEEHAFEPLPFLQLINLGGNLITQIQNGTFQAWHGMQFLEELILSHNPLSIIADTSFFELPSVKYLDLGATQVTQQTVLTLLLTTVRLETLKLPSYVACCLCQKKHTTEPSCRTIKFHCKNLCTTRALHCARIDPLTDTEGEIMEVVQSRKLNASTVLNLEPKESLLGDYDTVTLAVVLSVAGTDGDPNNHIYRKNSYSTQSLSRQEGKTSKELMLMLRSIHHMGWTSETDIRKLYFLTKVLAAEVKKKLHKAKSVVIVKNTASPLPTPTTQKHEVHKMPTVAGETTTGSVQKQQDLGLNQTALNPWEAAGRLNRTDNVSVFRHHKITTAPSKHSFLHPPAKDPHLSRSFKIQNYPKAVEQTRKTHGMEDVEDAEDAEEVPSPRQDYVWTYKKHKQGDNPYLNKSNQLFYETFGNVNPEEEPIPTESKAEQRLNTNRSFFYNLLASNSPLAASSLLENAAEEEASSLGRHLLAIPRNTKPHRKQQKEGSSFLNKSGSSSSPDNRPVQGNLFETKVHHQLHLLVPDEALRAFIAHVAQALRRECRLPKVQLACAKMVAKMGLLIKLLSKRQVDQGDSTLVGQCLLEGNVSSGMIRAWKAGRKSTGKWKSEYTSGDRLLLAISASIIIMICLMVICLIEVCSPKPATTSQPQSTSKSRPRWFFQKLLPQGWRKDKYNVKEQDSHVSDLNETKPQWLRNLYQPLDPQHKKSMAELYDEEISDEEIFNKSELK